MGLQRRRLNYLDYKFQVASNNAPKRIVFMTHGKLTSIGLVDEYALKAWALICELMLLRRGSHLLCQLMLLRRGPSLVC